MPQLRNRIKQKLKETASLINEVSGGSQLISAGQKFCILQQDAKDFALNSLLDIELKEIKEEETKSRTFPAALPYKGGISALGFTYQIEKNNLRHRFGENPPYTEEQGEKFSIWKKQKDNKLNLFQGADKNLLAAQNNNIQLTEQKNSNPLNPVWNTLIVILQCIAVSCMFLFVPFMPFAFLPLESPRESRHGRAMMC